MGVGDDYRLPGNYLEAYGLMADGLIVPVIRHLAAHILEPRMAAKMALNSRTESPSPSDGFIQLPRESKGRAVSHSVEVMSLRVWVNPSVTFAEYVCVSGEGARMTNTAGIPGDRICSFIERVEHIDEEIKALNEGKKEVFAEAKGEGFDVKVLKEILRLRKQDKDERDEQDPCSTCISEPWRTPLVASKSGVGPSRLRTSGG